MIKLSDEWGTPDWLFEQLDNEFHFDIDICATASNNKCIVWLNDALNASEWYKSRRERVGFCNPPYSNPKPFIENALKVRDRGTTVFLLKVDTSTKWWGLLWDYEKHCPNTGIEVRFLPKRIKFDPPAGYIDKVTTPAFPSCVVIVRSIYE